MTTEYVIEDPNNPHGFVCICGNKSNTEGFYPCDEAGLYQQPFGNWKNIYACDRCGRIINKVTLQVVGKVAFR